MISKQLVLKSGVVRHAYSVFKAKLHYRLWNQVDLQPWTATCSQKFLNAKVYPVLNNLRPLHLSYHHRLTSIISTRNIKINTSVVRHTSTKPTNLKGNASSSSTVIPPSEMDVKMKINNNSSPPVLPNSTSMDPMSSSVVPPRSSTLNLPPKPRKKVRNFVFSKFFTFVQGYNAILEKNFPGAMTVYRVFVVGFKDFAKELADYVMISKKVILSSNGVRDLSSGELDIFYRMPTEMFRVGPTLLVSALPFMNYVMFPIAYYFPKRLLSSHFWSLQQKSQFSIDFQRSRLLNYRPVFRSLQANVALTTDKELLNKCQAVLDKLGSGSHPSTRDIMDIKPLFESHPFSIQAIYGPHVKALCRMHGIHTLYWKRWRLKDRAEMLHVMDAALIREGIFNMKPDDLKTACFLRGLNASNTSREHMVEYLQQWSSISTSIHPYSYSLLLHLPILLAYNNPNNWALLAK